MMIPMIYKSTKIVCFTEGAIYKGIKRTQHSHSYFHCTITF